MTTANSPANTDAPSHPGQMIAIAYFLASMALDGLAFGSLTMVSAGIYGFAIIFFALIPFYKTSLAKFWQCAPLVIQFLALTMTLAGLGLLASPTSNHHHLFLLAASGLLLAFATPINRLLFLVLLAWTLLALHLAITYNPTNIPTLSLLLLALISAAGSFQLHERVRCFRKRIQMLSENIKESEEKFQTITNAAHSGIVIVNDVGLIELWNQKMAENLGWQEQEVLGQPACSILKPSQGDRICESLIDPEALPSDHPLEATLAHQQGQALPVEIAFAKVLIKNRIHTFAQIYDITTRKENEQKITQASTFISGIASALTELIANTELETALQTAIAYVGEHSGMDLAFLYQNRHKSGKKTYTKKTLEWQRTLDSFDLSLAKRPGSNDEVLFDESWPHWHQSLKRNMALFHDTDEYPENESGYLQSQGITHAVVLPIFVHDHFWGMLLFGSTEGTRSWARSQQSAFLTFAKAIGDAVKKTEDEKALRMAKDAAESATKAKSDFLANMSHEIRTPINAIVGMSHLLEKTTLNFRQQDYVRKIQLATNNLLNIINHILDFSKIEAGKLSIEQVPFSLHEVLESLSALTSLKAQEKGIELIFSIDQEIPEKLVGDPLRIGQVLMNLTSNAIKFTEHGYILVEIIQLRVFENQSTVQFTIEDTGIGMEPKVLSEIFQAFNQADTSTSRKYGGTGLGLTICKELISLMQGDLNVDSILNKGSRFHFTIDLPIVEDAVPPPPPAELIGQKLLVADSNSKTLDAIYQIYEAMNLRVTTVPSLEAALFELQKSNFEQESAFNFLLADTPASPIDTEEFLHTIADNAHIHIKPKIILLTNQERTEIPETERALGVSATLHKPVLRKSALAALQNARQTSTPETNTNANDKPQEIRPQEPPVLAGLRVLLVEDNEVNQQVAMELMASEGITVVPAMNGKEAINIAIQLMQRSESLDIILMDLQMPVMDGFEATTALRTIHPFTNIPIIAMTADVLSGVKKKCLDIGMNDYVAKPISPDALFKALAHWSKPGALSQPLPSTESITPAKERLNLNLPDTPGLDPNDGVYRMGGKIEPYLELLGKFAEKYSKFASTIEDMLSEKDITNAVKELHTFKGISGNIGAIKVYQTVVALERLVLANDPQTAPLVEKLHYQMAELLASIATLHENAQTADNQAPPEESGMSQQALQQRAERILHLIQHHDTEATVEVEALCDTPLAPPLQQHLANALKALKSYNFTEAEAHIKNLLQP